MPDNTIDLTKIRSVMAASKTSAQKQQPEKNILNLQNLGTIPSAEPPKNDDTAPATPKTPTIPPLLAWNATDGNPPVSQYWFLGPGAIALLFILIAILTHNYFFIAVIVLALFAVILYKTRGGKIIRCSVTTDGVEIGSRRYPFESIESFWIFRHVTPPELSLATKKRITPFVTVSLNDVNPTLVRNTLRRLLPEKQHEELMLDALSRKFGF